MGILQVFYFSIFINKLYILVITYFYVHFLYDECILQV